MKNNLKRIYVDGAVCKDAKHVSLYQFRDKSKNANIYVRNYINSKERSDIN